jgi:hypothetical protein
MKPTRSGYADVNGIRLYVDQFLADPMTAGHEEPRRG